MMSGQSSPASRSGVIAPLLSRTTIKNSVCQALRDLILDGVFLIMKRPDCWKKDFETNRLRLDAIADRQASRAIALTRQWHDDLLREIRTAIQLGEEGVGALLTDSADVVARDPAGAKR